jgi:3-phenylpropionate/trans-cinnamate dioxygenase ferredoxin component
MDAPFVAVAQAAAIPPGKFVKVAVDRRPYLIANVDGRYYAVEDNCSHEDYPLSYGCLDGDRIKCSLHGSRFSLATGEPVDEPADTPIRTYRCVVSGGQVWIDPGAPGD